jgi:DNA repair protein RadC
LLFDSIVENPLHQVEILPHFEPILDIRSAPSKVDGYSKMDIRFGPASVGPVSHRGITLKTMRYQASELPLKLDGFGPARAFFASCLASTNPARESFWVAHLDEQARCLHLSRYEGDATGTGFPLREIIRDAALYGSAGILLAHNHPSGDARPSDADCKATRRLASAAEALDCTILDHLIFAGSDCTSFRREGLL